MEELLEILEWYIWDHICCENFTADNRLSKDGLHTIRLVGAVMAYGILHGVPVNIQMPQFRYSSKLEMEQLIKDNKLDHYPIIHERDALMHLLAFREKTLPTVGKE